MNKKLLSVILIWAIALPSTINGALAEELPLLPAPDLAQNQLSTLGEITVHAYQLEGNSVFSDQVLQALLKEYLGTISAEQLQQARLALTEYYIAHGYINSGAIIPDQQVEQGIVRIQIIEGKLSEMTIGAMEENASLRLRENYLRARLADVDAPLNSKKILEDLQILQQNGLIKRFNAELQPGVKRGDAVLDIKFEENKPYNYGLSFNNHRAPSVGALRLESYFEHRNVTGYADRLYTRLGLSEGLNDFTVEYTVPISPRDTTLNLRAERSDSEVITQPFDMLNIESTATTYSLTVRQPLYVAYTEDFHYKMFDVSLGFEKRRSQTKLLNEPFSFPPLPQEAKGISRISALRFGQNWLDRSRTRVVAIASTFGLGLDVWDATINDGLDANGAPTIEPDGKFVTWVGQFRWVERLSRLWDSQLRLRLDLQYSNTDLLALEKFAIGGASTVRGYRENQFTRDRGLVASVEWHLPVGQVKIPYFSEEDQGQLTIVPFVDYGTGSNQNIEEGGPDFISSAGLGVLWQPHDQVQLELFWAKPLQSVAKSPKHDLQDEGIHFQVDVNF